MAQLFFVSGWEEALRDRGKRFFCSLCMGSKVF
jgi:hypothetical protein